MIKRIAAATALFAISSFAAWGRFPVIEAGKGQAKLALSDAFSTADGATGYDLYLSPQARYGVIPDLEVAVKIPVRIGKDDPTGLDRPVVGARYWLPMGVGLFFDVILPVANDDVNYPNSLGLSSGLQYANQVDAQLAFALEVAYTVETEKDNVDPGDIMALGGEVNYNLGMATPYAGLDFYSLGEGKDHGITSDSDNALTVKLGSGFAVAPSVGLDASATIGLTGFKEDHISLEASATFSF